MSIAANRQIDNLSNHCYAHTQIVASQVTL